jgi:hypothetical protein
MKNIKQLSAKKLKFDQQNHLSNVANKPGHNGFL